MKTKNSFRINTCRVAIGFGSIIFTSQSFAAAPIYFDIVGLALYVLLASLVIVTFSILFFVAKSKAIKKLSVFMIAICLAIPVLSISMGFLKQYMFKSGSDLDADLFGQYCSAHKNRTVSPQHNINSAVLYVRHEIQPGEPDWIGGAMRNFWRIRKYNNFCKNSSLRILDALNPASTDRTPYILCPEHSASLNIKNTPEEYEMLVRDSYESKNGAGRVSWGVTKMYKSSITITRMKTNKIIAEENFFFVGPRIIKIEARCPETDTAIIQLLTDTFPTN